MKVRSLWDCLNAHYPDDIIHIDYIRCSKGHILGRGNVHKKQADRGEPLIYEVCQKCEDFEPFDKPYKREVK